MCSLLTYVFIIYAFYTVGVKAKYIHHELNPKGSPQFRPDYEYHPDARGWFKLHKMPSKWGIAFDTCKNEGAMLASPLNENLLASMKDLVMMHGPSVFLGTRRYPFGEIASFDNDPFDEMALMWAPGEPNDKNGTDLCLAMDSSGLVSDVDCDEHRPFICYRKYIRDLTINECGTIDQGYVKEPQTGSCYKYHIHRMTWWHARGMCSSERATLAIINSDLEGQLVLRIIKRRFSKFFTDKENNVLHLGFLNLLTSDDYSFYTVNGETLEEAGFAKWATGKSYEADAYCGALVLGDEPFINTVHCEQKLGFVCEMNMTTFNNN